LYGKTPRTGVAISRAHPIVTQEILDFWGSRDGKILLDFWDSTQVRDPYNAEEVEDLFFGEVMF
jgi:hypothetical protein